MVRQVDFAFGDEELGNCSDRRAADWEVDWEDEEDWERMFRPAFSLTTHPHPKSATGRVSASSAIRTSDISRSQEPQSLKRNAEVKTSPPQETVPRIRKKSGRP